MNRLKIKSLLLFGTFFAAFGTLQTARAQYTVTGTTPGGGNIIVGKGSLGNLGPGAPLSAGGFDSVTLNIGSMATGSGADTIAFATSNNTLLNNGTILGAATYNAVSFVSQADLTGEILTNNGVMAAAASGDIDSSTGVIGTYGVSGSDAGVGVSIATLGNVGTVALSNAGTINGGSFGVISHGAEVGYIAGGNDSGANAGTGVAISSLGSAGTVTLSNAGTISGGNFGDISGGSRVGYIATGNGAGANAGTGVAISSFLEIGTVTLSNAGTISGGNFGNITGSSRAGFNGDSSAGANLGTGVAIDSWVGIGTVTLSNAGVISGGGIASIGGNSDVGFTAENNAGTDVGTGVAISGRVIFGTVTLSNAGTISGGNIAGINGSLVGVVAGAESAGGNVGAGVAVSSYAGIGTVTLSNAGTISGGGIAGITGGSLVGLIVNTDNTGANLGTGVAVSSIGNIGMVALSNAGTISGGNFVSISAASHVGDVSISNSAGANLGTGMAISSIGNIGMVTLTNFGTINGGSIAGISGGSIVGSVNASSAGGNVSVGVAVATRGTISNLAILNYGSITGGNIGSVDNTSTLGANAGSAIVITAAGGGSNLSITNYGKITGGNVGPGAPAGYGIIANTGNLVINNWGAISAGGGAAEAGLPAGFPAAAISVSGNNNTINLYGHSSVNGTIQGGAGSNNVLNLNFTGVSPFVAGNLKVQLMSPGQPTPWQGNGTPFVGTFTLRGDTFSVDPLNVFLNVTSYEQQAQTPNQFAIGASLDSATVNPAPGSPLFNLFNVIDFSGNVPLALEALSPQKYEVYGDLAIKNSTALVQEIDNRLTNLREGSENIDTTGVGGSTTTAGLSKDDSKESKEVVPAAQEKRWGFFATGNGLFFRGNPNNIDLQEGKANTVGTVAGVDAKAGEHAVIGALFAYDNTAATLGADGSHANIESYTPGIYGAFNMDGFYVNGLAAYTRNHYSSNRSIIFPGFNNSASASTNSNQYTVNLDSGYDWKPTDRLSVGPLAGVQYVHLDIDGFNESGAGAANLAVGSQNMDSLQSRVGGHINYHLQAQANVAGAVDAHAAWQHEYLNDSRGIGASFIGTGLTPFSIQTTSPRRDAGVVGLSVNFTFKDRVTLFADYDLLMWSASYFEQTINGGVRLSF